MGSSGGTQRSSPQKTCTRAQSTRSAYGGPARRAYRRRRVVPPESATVNRPRARIAPSAAVTNPPAAASTSASSVGNTRTSGMARPPHQHLDAPVGMADQHALGRAEEEL